MAGMDMRAATVTSLNVGMPQEVDWRGRTVWTGAWKDAVAGRRTVSRLNIDGDGQGDLAGHGGPNRAVLVYQEQAYEFWRELFGRTDLTAGRFGDNITIDGHPDDEVGIGDRFRIGSAEFEVSQPRVTCFRVGMRNDEPRLASLMVKHGRPGFYLRVLVEGDIGVGDQMTRIHQDPSELTVAESSALLYLPDPDPARIAVARDHPALSQGWRDSFADMLTPVKRTGEGVAPGWSDFRPLLVERVERETPTVSSFYLTEPEGLQLPTAQAGQYLTLRLTGSEDGSTLVRNYSLSALAEGAGYRISVKREPGGAFSNLLHDTVSAGDLVQVAAPRGEFVLRTGRAPAVLVSGGIGITPVLPMLQQLIADGEDRDIWWLHATRSVEEYPLVAEVHALAERTPYLHAHTWVTRSDPAGQGSTALGSWHRGRMTTEALTALDLPRDAHAYLCGPSAFIDAVTQSLVEVGLAPSAVSSELFGTLASLNPGVVGEQAQTPHLPELSGDGPLVTFTRSLLEVPWSDSYRSLLELAEACSVPTRWSCRTGVCHNCVTPLVSGTVTYVEQPLTDPDPGTALICCSRPDGEVVLDL
jgi:ferredoxin-NADP reductase/MOSC domain-containing protein YiiM/ferredoxin